jgi:hypothetical protein
MGSARVCGEHSLTSPVPSAMTGSAPLVRGTYRELLLHLLFVRFSPAHAGNMTDCERLPASHWVQPCAYGEHFGLALLVGPLLGSAPRIYWLVVLR